MLNMKKKADIVEEDWEAQYEGALEDKKYPPEYWDELIADPNLCWADIEEKLGDIPIPIEVLDKYSTHPKWEVRAIAANHRDTPLEVLVRLSTDKDFHIRNFIACNPNTPEEVVRTLIDDEDSWVQYSARKRLNIPMPGLEDVPPAVDVEFLEDDLNYMKSVGFPENFEITDGYDFGASEGQSFSPVLTIVDEQPPKETTQHQRDNAIIADLDKPIQLPPKPFIFLKDITPYLTNHDIVVDNIDRALLPGGTTFISSGKESVDPYVDLLTAKGYQITSDITTEAYGDEEKDRDRSVILQKPGNLPEGIAFNLTMKKKALEIGGVEFPDALKFKEETTSPLDVETDVQKLYKDAESFIINYIWSGLAAEGIVGPDDANVIQTDVDKVQFSSASSLVNQLMQEGWFTYLELSYDMKLRTDSQLQQQIFNAIQNAITEGVV